MISNMPKLLVLVLVLASLGLACGKEQGDKGSIAKGEQRDKQRDRVNKDFEELASKKKYSSDFEYMKEEEIIKTDVIALNKNTNLGIKDYKVSINQIDNSRFPEVTIVISVTDKEGNPLVVNKDFFRIEENGFSIPKQNIIRIVQKQELSKKQKLRPLNIILAIDKSRSMSQGIKDETKQAFYFAKEAAIEFIKQSQDNDIVRVIAFDGDLHLLGANETAIPRIERLKPKGSTALYAVLLNSVKELQLGGGIKAVILLTDGKNDTRGTINRSIKSISFDDGIYAANQLAIPVFTIGFGDKADKDTLSKIAKSTHGIFFSTGSKEEIKQLYRKIKDIINTQYLITYKSNSLEEVTDVQIKLGYTKDKRSFTTPEYIISREKQLIAEVKTIKAKEKELVTLQARIDKRLQDAINAEKEVNNKKASLQDREKEIIEKEYKLKEYEQAISALQNKLNKIENRLKNKEQDLLSKTTRLEKEKENLRQIQRAQEIRSASLTKKDAKIQEIELDTKKQKANLEKQKARVVEEQIELESKNKELARLVKTNKDAQTKLEKEKEKLTKELAFIKKLKSSVIAILNDVKQRHRETIDGVLRNEKELSKIRP